MKNREQVFAKLSLKWFNLNIMSRVCEICEKSYIKGNKVPRGIGNRVTNRAIKMQKPNLRTKRIETPSGNKVTIKLCASCLKRMKFEARKKEEALNK